MQPRRISRRHSARGSPGHFDRELLRLANSTDQQGNFLFSGFQNTAQPFTTDASGAVTYAGDTGKRTVQVSDSAMVPVADNGASVFLSVASIGTSAVAAGHLANSGTGVISGVSITNPTHAANGDTYTIRFGGGTPATTYDVDQYDPGTAATTTIVTGQPFTSGNAISPGGGQSVIISGAPAGTDKFSVTPAGQAAPTAPQNSTGMSANLSALISTLQQPLSSAAARANFQNALDTGTTRLENTMNNVTMMRASVGGREQEVQGLQTVTQNDTLQTQSNLADLTSTNLTQGSASTR